MSDASVGSIIGYLRLDRSDWDAELNAAGRKADDLARHSPNVKISTNAPSAIAQLATVATAVRRLQDAQGAENVAQAKLTELQGRGNASASQLAAAEERLQRAHRSVAAATVQLAAAHDKNDTAIRRAATDQDHLAAATDKSAFQMHLMRDALLLIAPAAIPIAAVAGGAILGLVPVAAAAILGIKGITQEYQSGALAGTQYGSDIKSLADEFTNLKQTAANGLLGGVDQAIQNSQPLFGALNQDIGTLSSQLGSIVAGAAPALLTILNALNPLFVTFGNLLSDGAAKLEHWATSSGGIQSFVAYVQAELPTVITALGQLVETAGRLLVALAPMGHVILSGIGTLASVLNAIPTNVLSVLATGALSLYAAFRGYGAITAIVNGVTNAVNAMKAPFVATAAQAEASSLEIQAAEAEAAAASARADAQRAESAAVAARAIAAETAGTSSILAEGAAATATAAEEQSLAFANTARAAEASAVQIRTSATAAAETVVAESRVASVGWASMLGPVGAVVIGVGLLAATFLHTGRSAQQAAADINTLTDALKADSGAVGDNTRLTAFSILQKQGATDAARKLGISMNDLVGASLGQAASQKVVNDALGKGRDELDKIAKQSDTNYASNTDLAKSVNKVSDAVGGTNKDLSKAIQNYKDFKSVQDSTKTAIDAAAVSAAKLYGLVGNDGVAAYLAATSAQQNATQQAQAQTLQFQLDNDAASLLAQTLDKLAGNNLGYAQAQNSFDSALSNMGDHISAQGKKITFTTTSIKNMSAASVQLRGQLLGQVTSAEQTAEAYGKMKGSSEAGRQELIKLRKQIIDNALAHAFSKKEIDSNDKAVQNYRSAIVSYINTVLKIPKKVPPTKLQIDASAAYKTIHDLISKRYTINVEAVAHGGIANLGNGVKAQAAGGPVGGSGAKGVDSQLRLLAPGEWVINDRAVDKITAMYGPSAMQMLNNGSLPKIQAPSSGASTTGTGGRGGMTLVQNIHPQPQQSEMAIAKAAAAEQLWALRR